MKQPRRPFHPGLIALLAALLPLWAGAHAAADDVKLNGFWIEDVEILSGDNGVLLYLSPAGGEVIRPISQLEGLRMDKYPGLAQAETLIAEENLRQAAAVLGNQRANIAEAWVTHYVDGRLVTLHNALGNAVPAVDAYLRLATSGAPAHYYENAPIQAVENANAAAKTAIHNLINASLPKVPAESPAQATLKAFRDFTQPAATPVTPNGQDNGNGNGDTTAPPNQLNLPGDQKVSADESAVELASVKMKDPDKLTNQLMKGEFDQVIDQTTTLLAGITRGNLYDLLYKRGTAYLGRARKTNSAQDYKHAGLDFMRIYVYTSSASSARPHAALAVAEVHHHLGKPKIAARFLEEAQRLILDPEDEPLLYPRLQAVAAMIQQPQPQPES